MKKVMIPWSGGFDSTLCILMAHNAGYSIDAVYSTIDNNTKSNEIEDAARRKLTAEFRKFGLSVYPRHINNVLNKEPGRVPLRQMPIWTNTLVYALDEHDEIWLGYKRNDDAISMMDEIRALWEAQKKCFFFFDNANVGNFGSRVNTSIEFPVKQYARKEVIDMIGHFDREHGTDIASLCTTCESGCIIDNDSCECSSCSEYRWAMGTGAYNIHRTNVLKLISKEDKCDDVKDIVAAEVEVPVKKRRGRPPKKKG